MLPLIFSYEGLEQALLTSQKGLSEELDVLAPEEVHSVNLTRMTQVVSILIVRAPNKSCHSGSRWLAGEENRPFSSSVLLH